MKALIRLLLALAALAMGAKHEEADDTEVSSQPPLRARVLAHASQVDAESDDAP